MQIDETLLQRSELINLTLRSIYSRRGFLPYRMSKFEEYDLYAKNKDFLVSDNVITFTDPSGRLMALKPDVTLSIIKNSRLAPGEIARVCYDEKVYRAVGDSFREIAQTGVECFGALAEDDLREVLVMAAESLKALGENTALAVSSLDIMESLISEWQDIPADRLYRAIGEKNLHEIDAICPAGSRTELLKRLLGLYGPVNRVLPVLDGLFGVANESYNRFRAVVGSLPEEIASSAMVDFSVTGDINYYNGIIFRGFIRGVPGVVLSGGQYDNLLRKFKGGEGRSIGFAVYTGLLDREAEACGDDWLNIALPKGRLGEKVYAMFAQAGFDCPSILEQNRKLVFENPENKVRYFWVKPSDVAIYVERGAADVGVAGKDILLEYEPEVYELLDLHTGICRMAVAAPKSFKDDPSRTLTVATKFSNIARQYYRSLGRDIDIVHLNGSIELAPILGLSDVIVDIVETGTTLRENNLEVRETIVPISARVIANKAAYKFKAKQIEAVAAGLAAVTEAKA